MQSLLLRRFSLRLYAHAPPPTRNFDTSAFVESGHNRWSKIARDKGAKDIEKGKLYSRTAQEILVSAKRGGSVDPALNVYLAVTLRKARANGVPKDNIEKALARASDKSQQDSLTSLMYEAIGPGQTGYIIECASDNIKRTNAAVHTILKDNGARSASVAYLFSRNGSIRFQPTEGTDPDAALDAAIEVGAEDVDMVEDGEIEVLTAPENMQSVAEALEKHPSVSSIKEITFIYRPIQVLEREGTPEEAELDEQVGRLVGELEDNDDVTAVYTTRG